MLHAQNISMFASASEKPGDTLTLDSSQKSLDVDSERSSDEFDRLFDDICCESSGSESEERECEDLTNKKSVFYVRKVDDAKISAVRKRLTFADE